MKNPLRKRLPRELKGELGKYLVVFILMVLTIGMVSGFLVADGSMIVAYNDGFEKYNFKSAIPARNRYMVDNSSYAICFVTHSWGGAAKTYERAKKKKLKIINLGVKEDGERKSDIQ